MFVQEATTAPESGLRRRQLGVLAMVGLAALAVGLPSAVAQEPVATETTLPEPDLSALDESVANGLRELRRFVLDRIAQVEDQRQLATPVGELGRAYLAHGLPAAAEPILEVAALLAPRDFRWPYYLGSIRQGDGRLDLAARSYERALSIAPGTAPAIVRLGRVYAALDRPEAAEWLFREVLADDPSNVGALAGLGALLAAVGRASEAVGYLESALERQPGADRLYVPLARAYELLGRGEAARAALAKRGDVTVQVVDPVFDRLESLAIGERLHLLRGREAYRGGRFEEAATEFRAAVEIDPESLGARLNLGAALKQLGDPDGAIAQYRRAVELAPEDKNANMSLGALLAEAGELEQALEHLQVAVVADPEDGQVHFDLAEALNRSGRADEALVVYRRAAELAPPGEMARFREVQLLSAAGRYAEAVERLEEGYELAPNSSLLALTLGRLLASADDLEVRDGERALEVLTNAPIRRSVRALETMAMAYAEVGRCGEAVEWQSQAWEAAIDSDREELSGEMESRVEYYRESRPCRFLARPTGG